MADNEKLDEWSKLDADEKRKFNGYNGFCNKAYFSENNAFMEEDKAKLVLRSQKELERRHKNGDKI